MAINSKLRILNIIAGAEFGGAESFFERLTMSFEMKKNIDQTVIIKENKTRYNLLKKNIENIKQIKLFNNLNPFCLFKVKKIISEFQPNIILTWMNRASNILPTRKHSNEINVGRLGGFYKIKNYVKCNYLITNTPDLKKYVITKGWDPKYVEYIPNFVSQSKNLNLDLGFSKEKTIICMGRFHKNKAIDLLIKSMPFLSTFNLAIVGNGKLKNSYDTLIKQFDLESRVKIFEWSRNISEYLNSSCVLVCPSRHEPFGNIVVDGWAHRIPVVVADTGGPGKIVKHKYNGLKFESENIFDLVSKIKELDSNATLRKRVVTNGFNEYKKNYSEDVIVSKYLNFFKRIT
jgi:glycosyltransferase involved in cell wall biosynthesis